MRNLKILMFPAILIISLMINGCAHEAQKVQYVYVPIPLERPERPTFPQVKGSDLSCVSYDTKQQLLMRDDIMKSYMNRLEAVIDGTKIIDP